MSLSRSDTLAGGAGADTFLLADGSSLFYLDGSTRNIGSGVRPDQRLQPA